MAKKKESKNDVSSKKMQELLIENFVGLQKAMTHLSLKFEHLSDQINRLLNVFEMSAKNIAGKSPEANKDVLNKIESLLEQNKTIARGLVLMEESLRPKSESPDNTLARPRPRPLPTI